MTRWYAIVMLLVLFAIAITSHWWQPLLDEYGRGLLVGLMSGVLLGQLVERRRVQPRQP